jgi:hypothetical protein
MTKLSLADIAASFIMQVTEDPNVDIGAISKSLFDAVNDVAIQAGASDFLMLAKRLSVVEVCTAQVKSREAFDQALANQDWNLVGPYACAHLMALNLVNGLDDADAAKTTAELSAHLYSQEYACRQIITRTASPENNDQD